MAKSNHLSIGAARVPREPMPEVRLVHATRLCVATVLWMLLLFADNCGAQVPEKDNAAAVVPGTIVIPEFKSRDSDGDGLLTEEEFVAGGGLGEPEILRRDFHMLDWNADGKMNHDEFLTVWYVVPEAQRKNLPDPFLAMMEAHITQISEQWPEWDSSGDGSLQDSEFSASDLARRVPGLEMTSLADWDRDEDGQVSQDDVRGLLELAYGVRRADGEVIRTEEKLANLAHFQNVDGDKNDRLSRDEYVRGNGNDEPAEKRFEQSDVNNDGDVTFAEWRDGPGGAMTSLGVIGGFRHLDTDLSAKLSQDELDVGPDWVRPVTSRAIPAFDADQDGEISLREFRLLPNYNLVVAWHFTRTDSDGDGRLSFEEFRWGDGLAVAAMRMEYFTRLDLNDDGYLDMDEWEFHSTNPRFTFKSRDSDGDGVLSEEEFVAGGGLGEPEILRRDFHMLDWNADGLMDYDEFLTVWYLVPEAERRNVPDAVIGLMEAQIAKINEQWAGWDASGDGSLQDSEFSASDLARRVPGLEMTSLADWDRDGDGQVSQDDVRGLLELAYGVRRADGELLRTEGKIAAYAHFLNVDLDKNDRLSHEEFVSGNGKNEHAEKWFEQCDVNCDGDVTFPEWRDGPGGSTTSLNVIDAFRRSDTDLNAKLNRDELAVGPDWIRPVTSRAIPVFDDDRDGEISLREFQLFPHYNLVVAWHFLRTETDHDGRLSFAEFKWGDGLPMAGLRKEYFTRLDRNDDGYLDLDEWDFALNFGRAPRQLVFKVKDTDEDGWLSFDEVRGTIAIPKVGDPYNLGQETLLVRIEEAFRRADADGDGMLSLAEFDTDDGIEAVAPGAAALVNRFGRTTDASGAGGRSSIRVYAILGFNLILAVAVLAYIAWRPKHA